MPIGQREKRANILKCIACHFPQGEHFILLAKTDEIALNKLGRPGLKMERHWLCLNWTRFY